MTLWKAQDQADEAALMMSYQKTNRSLWFHSILLSAQSRMPRAVSEVRVTMKPLHAGTRKSATEPWEAAGLLNMETLASRLMHSVCLQLSKPQ